ncbi:unnamed protein product [Sphenostylis stenocarpa]|uniref:Uncharacterized protein n=1 Tax=Sphenostylis stenocarpa TaxID=92480 RepID=A0AA86SRB7_9FABA|nr:unnamed protein product [Sphenostylis stenocarpa]
MFPFLSLKLSVKHNRKHEAPPHRGTSAVVIVLLAESQLPIFLKIRERSWKARTVPVGKRLEREVGKLGLGQLAASNFLFCGVANVPFKFVGLPMGVNPWENLRHCNHL